MRRAGGRQSLHPETPDGSGESVLARRKFPASPAANGTSGRRGLPIRSKAATPHGAPDARGVRATAGRISPCRARSSTKYRRIFSASSGGVRVRSCSGSSGSESFLRSAARAISWQETEETPTRSAVSIRSRQDAGNLRKSPLMNHSQTWVSSKITSGIPNPLRQRWASRCLLVS